MRLEIRRQRGYMLVLNALMGSMIAMFMALGINSFIIVTGRLQQRNTAEYIATAMLHYQKTYPLATEEELIDVGLEVGKQHIVGLKTAYLVEPNDLVMGESVQFGTYTGGSFTPEVGPPGPRTAIKVALKIKSNSIVMMALGLFGMSDHPLFKSEVIVTYQSTANPNHQRYFVVE